MRPILFTIGNFPIHSFGVMMVLAFFASLGLVRMRAAKYGFSINQISDVFFWALIAGIIGARVVYIAQELPYYLKHTDELLSWRFQGLTSFGGLIFGALVVVFWAVKHKANLKSLLDLAAPGFLVGHAIGRIGCLLNGCCFGGACPADVPWGIHVAGQASLHHPAQVYDSLMNVAAVALVLLWERRGALPGQIFGAAIALHGLARFIYEFWRAGTDDQVARGEASSTYWGSLPITQAQGMAAVLIVVGVFFVVKYSRGTKPVASVVAGAPSA